MLKMNNSKDFPSPPTQKKIFHLNDRKGKLAINTYTKAALGFVVIKYRGVYFTPVYYPSLSNSRPETKRLPEVCILYRCI